MLLGPIFHFELVRIARRRRFFAMRFAFGFIVLGIIGLNFLGYLGERSFLTGSFRPDYSLSELAGLGRSLFASIMGAQTALVLVLTPALVADAIASERQRKTLQDLLTTQLSGREIVLGKLGARLANVLSYLALVLPIASLLTLFGGVSPETLLWGDLALVSTAYFLGGLAILASVLARRSRDAVGLAYSQVALWALLPQILDALLGLLPPWLSTFSEWVKAANDWVWPASPLVLLTGANSILSGETGVLRDRAIRMIVSQVVYGTLFVALAAWQLRPAYRRLEGLAGRRPRSLAARIRWRPRPPCGDDPIYWKEAFVGRSRGGILTNLGRLCVPALLGLCVLGALFASRDALIEIGNNGYFFHENRTYVEREQFNIVLRFVSTSLCVPWVLWLSSVTAAGFTTEREQDTWISLLATPLQGDEILRGKMLGALRTTAPFGIAVVALWLYGLLIGAIHPVGFALVLLSLAVYVWFVTVLGTFFSLRSATTWRAQVWSLAIVLAPNFCCFYFSPLFLIAVAPLSQVEMNGLWVGLQNLTITPPQNPWEYAGFLFVLVYIIIMLASYPGSAYIMMRWSFDNFDRLADRPRITPGQWRLRSPVAKGKPDQASYEGEIKL